MAKSSVGEKHVCPECAAKFFDLGKTPPTCPKCGAVIEVVKAKAKPKAKPVPVPVPAPVKKAPESDDDDDDIDLDLVEDIDDDLVEDDDDDDEEEDKGLMEDASDLSDLEDEISRVNVHVEGSDREGS